MSGAVHVPWYATGFRGDQLQAELERVSPLAFRYGATAYSIYRSRDDRYRILQVLMFDDHHAWERWWYGPEMVDLRTYAQGWYQIPVLYVWNDLVAEGRVPARESLELSHGH